MLGYILIKEGIVLSAEDHSHKRILCIQTISVIGCIQLIIWKEMLSLSIFILFSSLFIYLVQEKLETQ